jgi:hypothetical protein
MPNKNLFIEVTHMAELLKNPLFIRLKEATRPIWAFVYQYRYRFILLLGLIIAFFPSLMFLIYSVFGLKE